MTQSGVFGASAATWAQATDFDKNLGVTEPQARVAQSGVFGASTAPRAQGTDFDKKLSVPEP